MRLHVRSVSAAATSWTNPSSTRSLQPAELVPGWRECGEVAGNGGEIMPTADHRRKGAKNSETRASRMEIEQRRNSGNWLVLLCVFASKVCLVIYANCFARMTIS